MCKRNTLRKKLAESDVKKLWFSLLNNFLNPLLQLRLAYEDKHIEAEATGKEELLEVIKNNQDQMELYTIKLVQVRERKEELEDEEDDEDDRIQIEKDEIRYKKLLAAATQKLKLNRAKLEKMENQAQETLHDKNAPQNMHKLVNLWMQRIYLKLSRLSIAFMIGSVPVPDILDKIVVDAARNETFGQIRDTIFRMLSLYNYGHTLMDNANNIMERDTFTLVQLYMEQLQRGIIPTSTTCSLCTNTLARQWHRDDQVRVFTCGHAYHNLCLGGLQVCPQCTSRVIKKKQKKSKLLHALQVTGGEADIKRLKLVDETTHEESKMDLLKQLLVESNMVNYKYQKRQRAQGNNSTTVAFSTTSDTIPQNVSRVPVTMISKKKKITFEPINRGEVQVPFTELFPSTTEM